MVKEYRLSLDLQILIEESRSSKNMGPKLVKTHVDLGEVIGKELSNNLDVKDITIIAIMRAGLPFAQGIWQHFPYAQFLPIKTVNDLKAYDLYLNNRTIIVVDSVVNTGKSILPILNYINDKNNNIIVATNVINNKAVSLLSEFKLHTIRISTNSYVGTKTIDTGNRLFNTIDLE